MTSYLGIIAAGHIGSVDPLQYTQSGTPLARFTLAVNVKSDQVLWLKVACFGKLAEAIHPHLAQGKHVLIESNELKVHGYLSGGIPKGSADVIARSVKFMGKRTDQEAEPQGEYNGFEEVGGIPF
jgi:single-stranded DNA-binding protein